MPGVALNFFPLSTDDFSIAIHRLPFEEGHRPEFDGEMAVKRWLPDGSGKRTCYWTLFQAQEQATEVICKPFDDIYVTIDALRLALVESCKKRLEAERFVLTRGFRRRIEIVLAAHPEGNQVVSLEPYLLRARGEFGFLADFRFRPTEKSRGSRRALELSLSLDKAGQRNRNYYADRYSQLSEFVAAFHRSVFPVTVPGGQSVDVETHLTQLEPSTLDVKHYLVGASTEAKSQFMGVKQAGPLEPCPKDARLCFLYRAQDRALSQDLFRALRGDTFQTFPGMERMFGFRVSNENVTGASMADFGAEEIRRVADRVVADADGRNTVPVVLTPFSRHDAPEENAAYWSLKHAFLSRRLPIQVVATETVNDKNKLKWSASSIGLQIFAKAGGIPWQVRPQSKRCLIVGIGQAHRVTEGTIERFFAYSVLTDSSGAFEEVRVLGEGGDEESYLRDFGGNLRRIFADYSTRFDSFVVHATFAIRRQELQQVADVLTQQAQRQPNAGEFVALKFNDRSRFFGFASDHNSRVPYESTVTRLSREEFLVWFEGLQYGQPTLRDMVGGPLHVKFTYPREGLSERQQRDHLQDAINLSGANWRGFNAKSLPVSVYYAQLIARYLKEFDAHGLSDVDVEVLSPWFL